jgi:hypothetical protein
MGTQALDVPNMRHLLSPLQKLQHVSIYICKVLAGVRGVAGSLAGQEFDDGRGQTYVGGKPLAGSNLQEPCLVSSVPG